MTTDLEKQFFDTFGIKPRIYVTSACGKSEYKLPSLYPEITDRILLELICITNMFLEEGYWSKNMADLKEEILKRCLLAVNTTDYGISGFEDVVKHQVQALFKEER